MDINALIDGLIAAYPPGQAEAKFDLLLSPEGWNQLRTTLRLGDWYFPAILGDTCGFYRGFRVLIAPDQTENVKWEVK